MAKITAPDKYRYLFENLADPILIIENGRFTDCNQAVVSMLGLHDKSEVLNLHPSEISPEFQPDGQRSIDKAEAILARTENEPNQCFEWTHTRADGSLFPVEVALTVLPGEDGPIIHTTWRDIAARKQLEKEHRHFQKMDAIGKLAGGIAHDFNNHLVPIIGYAELLTDKLGDDTVEKKWATEIHRAAQISAMMIGKILAVSRKDLSQPVIVELNSNIINLLDMLRTLIGENIRIDFEPATQPVHIRIGAGDIDQILLNLATNARDCMPEGGVIAIKTFCDDGQACLSVRDDGTGMDKLTVSRAFEPFFTTKALGTGTGLGLSTVYGIVTDARGKIDISSTPGIGTTVNMRFPITDKSGVDVQDVDAQEVFRPTRAANRGYVLLVEDNRQVSRFANLVLESDGFRVSIAEDAQQGMELYAKERPDIILSDIVMPGMSGPRMIKELGGPESVPPVIFMSGYTEDRLTADGYDMSSFPLIRKPFSRAVLIGEIAKALDKVTRLTSHEAGGK